MHWPPTNQWTAALQSYSQLVEILQRCETGDSTGLYSVSECTKNLLMKNTKILMLSLIGQWPLIKRL